MSNTRRGTLTERAFCRGRLGGVTGTRFSSQAERKGGQREGGRERRSDQGAYAASLTFSTNADFKHPGAEAVAGRHAEAFVGGIFLGAHEHVVGGREAVRLDAFHLHVPYVSQMDGPDERREKRKY